MLYFLSEYFKHYFPLLNVVHYVSFRVLAALLSTLIFSIVFGNWFIEKLGILFRSKSRPYTPENHRSKDDLPTMGGLFIVAAVVCNIFLWSNLTNPLVWIVMLCLVGFAAIGSWDDWIKIKNHQGISSSTKFTFQVGIALIVVFLWIVTTNASTSLTIPFFKNVHPNFGWLLIPWAIFIIVGCSNAVNLTDGLDGLAITSLMQNFLTFSIICYIAGNFTLASYLHLPFAGTAEVAIIGVMLFGASLGFLWYNAYPAQIFMGDAGSLALGATLALMALMAKQELLLAISGGLFVMETLSVIVQVLSYKILGRRFFKMAPIHHHFELLGWPESKITVRFGIISIILCLFALMTLKIR